MSFSVASFPADLVGLPKPVGFVLVAFIPMGQVGGLFASGDFSAGSTSWWLQL